MKLMKKSELRQIIREELQKLDEKYLGSFVYGDDYTSKYNRIDIYKNPKHIKNFPINTRGWIDEDGNLFLTDRPEMLHNQIYSFLKKRLDVRPKIQVVTIDKETIELQPVRLDKKTLDIVYAFNKKNPNIETEY